MRHVTTTTLQTRRCLRAALRRWFVDDPDVTLVPPQRQNPAWTSPEHNAHEKQLPSRISKYSSTDSLNPAPCCISHHQCPSAGAGGQVRAGPPPAAAAARPFRPFHQAGRRPRISPASTSTTSARNSKPPASAAEPAAAAGAPGARFASTTNGRSAASTKRRAVSSVCCARTVSASCAAPPDAAS